MSTHAVVIGGSMAGLCAGRVLSEFYDQVTIIDRDVFPDGALERAGVPQSRHVHALLARGCIELENLFPGFGRLMVERGAHVVDFGTDFAALRGDGWGRREATAITTLFASRILLESIVRELAKKLPNLRFIDRTEVAGLLAAADNSVQRLTGVKLRSRDQGGSSEMAADLVVDASGRSSKVPGWLQELGLKLPQETVVDSFSGYSSRWFKAPAERPREWWWKGIWLDPKEPDHLSAGVLFPVENGRWIVTIAGINKNFPPSDEAGFMAALSKLRSPIIAEAVKHAEPLSPVYSHRAMANRWRHYEKWQERLDGFIALGDSSCAFNPVYGQGMTSGALSALLLRETLQQTGCNPAELPRAFFAKLAKFQSGPWALATGADFSFKGTEGKRPLASYILSPLFNALLAAAADDRVVQKRLIEVINLLRPADELIDRQITVRLLKNAFRRLMHRSRPAPIPAMPPAVLEPATEL